MEKKTYLFIDFEFTMPEKTRKFLGFFPEIIEAGIVYVRNQTIVEQFSSYIIPVQFPKLSGRCKSFLGISQDQVDNGISFSEFVEILNEFEMDQPSTVVTWGNMDMKVLRQNCQSAHIPFPLKGPQIDLSLEYKRFFGDQNQTGLWKAVQQYGKEGTGKHHRALDDALTTYNIFRLVEKDKQYLNRPNQSTIGDRIDFSKLFNEFA